MIALRAALIDFTSTVFTLGVVVVAGVVVVFAYLVIRTAMKP